MEQFEVTRGTFIHDGSLYDIVVTADTRGYSAVAVVAGLEVTLTIGASDHVVQEFEPIHGLITTQLTELIRNEIRVGRVVRFWPSPPGV